LSQGFLGIINVFEAEELIKYCSEKVFLIRFSRNNPELLTIDYGKDVHGKVHHTRKPKEQSLENFLKTISDFRPLPLQFFWEFAKTNSNSVADYASFEGQFTTK